MSQNSYDKNMNSYEKGNMKNMNNMNNMNNKQQNNKQNREPARRTSNQPESRKDSGASNSNTRDCR